VVEDVNEFIPEWKDQTYVAEVTEGRIEKRILQLDAADADGSEEFSKICHYHLLSADVPFEISAEGTTGPRFLRVNTFRIKDLRSFEIRYKFESAVPAPLLVVSLFKRLKPLMALSGTVYRLASSMSDHTPVA